MDKRILLGKIIGIAVMAMISISIIFITDVLKKEPIFLYTHCMCPYDGEKFEGWLYPPDYGIDTWYERVELDDVDKNTKSPINENVEYQYKSSECRFESDKSEAYGDFYSVYDEYVGSDESEIVYLHGTEIICSYSGGNEKSSVYIGSHEEEMKQIAEEFLKKIHSEDTLSKFTYEGFVETDRDYCVVSYCRYIGGYKTDETISVAVDKNGRIQYYSGYNVKKYDDLETAISESDIEEAKELLEEKLELLNLENARIEATEIITNKSGDLFFTMKVGYGKTEDEHEVILMVSM